MIRRSLKAGPYPGANWKAVPSRGVFPCQFQLRYGSNKVQGSLRSREMNRQDSKLSPPFYQLQDSLFERRVYARAKGELKRLKLKDGTRNWRAWFKVILASGYPTNARMQALAAVLEHGLQTNADVHQFMEEFLNFRKALGLPKPFDERKQVLRTYNALVLRLAALNVPLNPKILEYGILLSAYARSTQALWHYGQLAKDNALQPVPSFIRFTLREIFQWCESSNGFLGSEGQRTKSELLRLFTGQSLRPTDEENTRNNAFRSLIHPTNPAHSTYFFRILGSLSGTEELYRVWSEIFQKVDRQKKRGSSEDFKCVANDAIQALVLAGGPQEAWAVFRDLKWDVASFSADTWTLLFEHPKYMMEWQPGMEGPVLEKYTNLIEGIERALGVTWTGGEDGGHVFFDQDWKEEFDDTLNS